ncbi:MAG: type IV pilus modification protein PilV [Chromatiales bacterium]|nr:type IV pilus modification protein PilV [Chromatiales bacterium]
MLRHRQFSRRAANRALSVNQRGVTMIEVMIAIVVLAIGLIGLARLQAATLQFNNSAYLRSQATNLASDMADRMRANRAAALGPALPYNLDVDDVPPGGGTLAADDLNEWRAALAGTLPSGTGGITVTGAGRATIVVCWDDTRGEGFAGAPAACAAEGLMGFRFETQL